MFTFVTDVVQIFVSLAFTNITDRLDRCDHGGSWYSVWDIPDAHHHHCVFELEHGQVETNELIREEYSHMDYRFSLIEDISVTLSKSVC